MSRTGETARPALSETVVVPDGTPSWITSELLILTRNLFERRYKASLGVDEAVRILARVGTFLDTVLRPKPSLGCGPAP